MADKKNEVEVEALADAELKEDTLSVPAEEEVVVVEEELPVAVEVVEEEPAVVEVEEEPAVANNGEVVEVFEDKIIYLNKRAKKSMSVWQVQRRLYDLGYKQVKKAKPGYFEEITLEAVEAFRADKNLGAGAVDAKFLKALFAGDKSVNLILV